MSRPAPPPVALGGGAAAARERFATARVPVPAAVLDLVREGGGTVELGDDARAEAARDWWPLGIGWATRDTVPARPEAVVRPVTTDQVAALLRACSARRVPVTPVAGRSGVCGGCVPLFGGVALDTTGLCGEVHVDETSLVCEAGAGTAGRALEDALRATGSGYTLGHWPQSIDLSTVGGWVACRSAGQYSTRYGKIEDMVAGLEVALADGRVVRTGGLAPRAATGPDLTQLFTGSEGVLGVITRVWLRVHPAPAATERRAYGFSTFGEGMDACRRVLRRGATPAVVRLYDAAESERVFSVTGQCVLVVLDEADPGLLAATVGVVDEECRGGARLDDALVDTWLASRYDVSLLVPLWRAGVVVDTAEVAGRWGVLGALAHDVAAALGALDETVGVSVHLSHAYVDGACLYFTFAGAPPEAGEAAAGGAAAGGAAAGGADAARWAEPYYVRAWDALTAAVARHGAAISHHHGIGLSRARHLASSLGEAHALLVAMKRALDPAGILNPGKLGIPSEFGEVPWP